MNLNLFVFIEVFLITMLTVIIWNQDSKKLNECSRDRSRIVRDIISKKFLPIFAQYKVLISKDCPFHPDRDYLWWPFTEQDYSDPDSDLPWTCPFCGLDFSCPERLAVHWDEEHRNANIQKYRDDLVCLADYCDIFRCDVLIMKRMQHKKRQRLMGYLSFGQEEMAACDPHKMVELKKSCQNVIRQCTISLETNVSSQNMLRVEKELSDSICLYLTCDHYNDDTFVDDNSRKVPTTLFSIIGVIMVSGFCLCYYLIWSLLKRGLIKLNELSKNDTTKLDNKLKLSFGESRQNLKSNASNNNNNNNNDNNNIKNSNNNNSNKSSDNYKNSHNFFQNIFEFNREHKEDTFEFSDYNSNMSDYERKLHSISSIIEEDEDKDVSDIDISYNSYPIINSKYTKKKLAKSNQLASSDKRFNNSKNKGTVNLYSNFFSNKKSSKDIKNNLKQIQEICLQDLPVKIHSKFIQPLKYSYSDRYPCYSGSSSASTDMLANICARSRSYSHSHLRNPPSQHFVRIAPRVQRQNSIDEECTENSPFSNSSMSIRTANTGSKSTDYHDRIRNYSRPPLSYHESLHSSKSNEPYNLSMESSKTNSNASITSRISAGSRLTTSSSQTFSKR